MLYLLLLLLLLCGTNSPDEDHAVVGHVHALAVLAVRGIFEHDHAAPALGKVLVVFLAHTRYVDLHPWRDNDDVGLVGGILVPFGGTELCAGAFW